MMSYTLIRTLNKNNFLIDKKNSSVSGMSLLEIILVIVLFAVVYAVAVPQLNFITGVKTSDAMSRFAADIKSAFDTAVLSRKYYRIAFDTKTNQYWLEVAPDNRRVFLDLDLVEAERSAAEIKADFDQRFDKFEDLNGQAFKDSDSGEEIKPVSPLISARSAIEPIQWTRVENTEWGGRDLGLGLMLSEWKSEPMPQVIRPQERTDVGGNMLYLYFFPEGYVQEAFIKILPMLSDTEVDRSQEPYVIVTIPREGVAQVLSGDLDPETARREVMR